MISGVSKVLIDQEHHWAHKGLVEYHHDHYGTNQSLIYFLTEKMKHFDKINNNK